MSSPAASLLPPPVVRADPTTLGYRPPPAGAPVPVCHVISSFFPVVGGAERATEGLCAELVRAGLEVTILTRRYPGLPARDVVAGVPVHRAGWPGRSKLAALTFGAHALVLLATRLARCRVVHAHNAETPLLVGLAARLILRRRLVVTIHSNPAGRVRPSGASGALRFRLIRRLADRVGTLNGVMRDELAAAGLPTARIAVLPNGVDVERFRPPTREEKSAARRARGLPARGLVHVFVGRLVGLKRVDLLLEAWARLPHRSDRRLLIVGDGPELPTLRAQAAALGLDSVRFEGSTDAVIECLHAADVFVLPSRREGQSVALLEAMATGLAPVASDLPANATVVADGENGLLFPVDDLDGLVLALSRSCVEDVRNRLSGSAIRSVREHHSLTACARRHRVLYADLTPSRSR